MLFYLKYLLLTLAFELPLMAWIFRKDGIGKAVLVGALMNTLTNPLLNYLLINYGFNLWLLELGALVLEAICIRLLLRQSWPMALGISLVLNGFSLTMGFALHALDWI